MVNQSIMSTVCWESVMIGDDWGKELVILIGCLDGIGD